MLGLHINIEHIYPLAAFIAGLSGSIHCAGMCGGLVTATCQNKTDIVKYQLGRLLGYSFLGLIGGMIGFVFNVKSVNPYFTLITGLFLGLMFIYWGVKSFGGKNVEVPLPRFFGRLYTKSYSHLVKENKLKFSRSFFTGLISILLPCGLLYGVIIGAIATNSLYTGAIAMLCFWIGTLPTMMLVPNIFQRVFNPFQKRHPRSYALILIMIGLLTISSKVHSHYSRVYSPEKQDVMCH